MNLFSVRKGILVLLFTVSSFLTLPVFAWPEVDHMNMCGTATKAVQGGFTNWAQYDRYVAQRGNAYYLRTNCPNIVAPIKKKHVKKVVYKKATYKKATYKKRKTVKRISKRSTYNEKLDCARVDRMNGVISNYSYKKAYKKTARKSYRKTYKKIKRTKKLRFAKSSKARLFKRTVKYNEKADCARVDRMNGYR